MSLSLQFKLFDLIYGRSRIDFNNEQSKSIGLKLYRSVVTFLRRYQAIMIYDLIYLYRSSVFLHIWIKIAQRLIRDRKVSQVTTELSYTKVFFWSRLLYSKLRTTSKLRAHKIQFGHKPEQWYRFDRLEFVSGHWVLA